MKKCVIFFTLLIIALMIAVLAEGDRNVDLNEDVVMGKNNIDNLLVTERRP